MTTKKYCLIFSPIEDERPEQCLKCSFVRLDKGKSEQLASMTFTIAEARSLSRHFEEFLKKNHIALSEISGIVILSGIAHFTTARVIVVASNAIGYSANIPVRIEQVLPTLDALREWTETASFVPCTPTYAKDPVVSIAPTTP